MKKKNIMNNESAKGRHIGLPLRWMTMMMAALAFTACSNDDDTLTAEQEITLTTPVIQLSGVQASTRAVQDMADVASGALVSLYLHDSEAREYNQNRAGNYVLNDPNSWRVNESVTVTGGEGHYRAGVFANISLNATADMSEIRDAVYAYRGSVNVKADGTFTPDGTLQPHSAAVLLNLKDADGNAIYPDGTDATSGKENWNVYLIKPVGLAHMNGFVPTDADGQYFPNGTADPVPNANTWPAYYLSTANGNYTPGTYPATWENNVLVTSAVPGSAWPLFEVTYCKDGFKLSDDTSDYVPLGTATTWTVRYPREQQLTLEAGKLYTFTAALGADAYISIKASDVSISDWIEGETINVGR
ncbi:MAG: hypothetical protein IKK62_10925 [Bacteroidaceae bacterium]|nr:hypothetical protein [Bacteroidaceae bacterium]